VLSKHKMISTRNIRFDEIIVFTAELLVLLELEEIIKIIEVLLLGEGFREAEYSLENYKLTIDESNNTIQVVDLSEPSTMIQPQYRFRPINTTPSTQDIDYIPQLIIPDATPEPENSPANYAYPSVPIAATYSYETSVIPEPNQTSIPGISSIILHRQSRILSLIANTPSWAQGNELLIKRRKDAYLLFINNIADDTKIILFFYTIFYTGIKSQRVYQNNALPEPTNLKQLRGYRY
jgi:hypothetical protein